MGCLHASGYVFARTMRTIVDHAWDAVGTGSLYWLVGGLRASECRFRRRLRVGNPFASEQDPDDSEKVLDVYVYRVCDCERDATGGSVSWLILPKGTCSWSTLKSSLPSLLDRDRETIFFP